MPRDPQYPHCDPQQGTRVDSRVDSSETGAPAAPAAWALQASRFPPPRRRVWPAMRQQRRRFYRATAGASHSSRPSSPPNDRPSLDPQLPRRARVPTESSAVPRSTDCSCAGRQRPRGRLDLCCRGRCLLSAGRQVPGLATDREGLARLARGTLTRSDPTNRRHSPAENTNSPRVGPLSAAGL